MPARGPLARGLAVNVASVLAIHFWRRSSLAHFEIATSPWPSPPPHFCPSSHDRHTTVATPVVTPSSPCRHADPTLRRPPACTRCSPAPCRRRCPPLPRRAPLFPPLSAGLHHRQVSRQRTPPRRAPSTDCRGRRESLLCPCCPVRGCLLSSLFFVVAAVMCRDSVGALTSAVAELLGPEWSQVGASGPAWRRGASSGPPRRRWAVAGPA